MKMAWVAIGLSVLLCAIASAQTSIMPEIQRLEPPEGGFYSKSLNLGGILIKGHAVVSDAAMQEAYRRLHRLLENIPRAWNNLASAGAEFHIIGRNQMMVDLPECRIWRGKKYEGNLTLDQRERGWGGLMSSCGEDNLLALPNDHFFDHRDICSHEFAHTLMSYGLSDNVLRQITDQYQASTSKGLWKSYAGTNEREFFAELTMWYFNSRGDYGNIQPPPRPGRAWLAAYDPEAFRLLDDLYGGRLPIAAHEWKLLPLQTPDHSSQLRSQPSTRVTSLIVRNLRSSKCEVFWSDFSGKLSPYGEIQSWGTWTASTFVDHAWLFTDENLVPIFTVIAQPEPGRVDLR
jgi:hypothetical protein